MTEFTTNTTKALDSKALILSETAGKLLIIDLFIIRAPSCPSKRLYYVEYKIRFCRMLLNNFGYP